MISVLMQTDPDQEIDRGAEIRNTDGPRGTQGRPWWLRWQRICLQCRRPEFDPWVRKIPWRREWLTHPVFLTGEFHRPKSLEGYCPWGHKRVRHD